jgi:hypothetical protein
MEEEETEEKTEKRKENVGKRGVLDLIQGWDMCLGGYMYELGGGGG